MFTPAQDNRRRPSGVPRTVDVTGLIPTVGADGKTITNATVVPDGATAIVANVTIVSPTTAGFVSVRPGSAAGTPTTSSLNAASAEVIVPNSVTVELPTAGATAGQIQLWFQGTNPNATAHLLVDIVGYYQPAAAATGAMTFVGTFRSLATVGIGDTAPAAPTSYTASFDLDPDTYYVTGDLTVRNAGTVDRAVVRCQLYRDEAAIGNPAYQEVSPSGPSFTAWVHMSFADTFSVPVGGPTTVSYRCLRIGSPAMYYEYLNLNIFRTA